MKLNQRYLYLGAIAIFTSWCNEDAVIYRPLAMAALTQFQEKIRAITEYPDLVCEFYKPSQQSLEEMLQVVSHPDLKETLRNNITAIRCLKKGDLIISFIWVKEPPHNLYLLKANKYGKLLSTDLKISAQQAVFNFFSDHRVARYRGYTSLNIYQLPNTPDKDKNILTSLGFTQKKTTWQCEHWEKKITFPGQS